MAPTVDLYPRFYKALTSMKTCNSPTGLQIERKVWFYTEAFGSVIAKKGEIRNIGPGVRGVKFRCENSLEVIWRNIKGGVI